MGTGMRAATVGILAAALTVALHMALLQAWVGPFPLSWEWDHLAVFVVPAIMAIVVAGTVSDIGDERAGRWLRERDIPDGEATRGRVRRWVRLTRTSRALGFFGVGLVWVVQRGSHATPRTAGPAT